VLSGLDVKVRAQKICVCKKPDTDFACHCTHSLAQRKGEKNNSFSSIRQATYPIRNFICQMAEWVKALGSGSHSACRLHFSLNSFQIEPNAMDPTEHQDHDHC
jgi:hypothetical protein